MGTFHSITKILLELSWTGFGSVFYLIPDSINHETGKVLKVKNIPVSFHQALSTVGLQDYKDEEKV